MQTHQQIESLLALNQEIALLVRAGVPLAAELPASAERLTEQQSPLLARVQACVQAGAPLDEALAQQGDDIPETYVTLVRAGLAADRLPAALEAFGVAYRRLANLRRGMAVALVYPVAVAMLAVVLLVFAALELLPTYSWLGADSRITINRFVGPGGPRPVVWLGAAAVAAVLAAAAWRVKRNPIAAAMGLLGWAPGVGATLRLSGYAAYTWTLCLLVQNRVPLASSLRLSAEASGWRRLEEPSLALAAKLERGGNLRAEPALLEELPPLVRIGLLIGDTPERLAEALAAAAEDYDRRARESASRVAAYFPAAAVAVIGGTTLGVYAYLMLQPYVQALIEIVGWRP
ncbi:MAG: type II secretion system F family protein [Planctomycetota bacterium]